MKSESHIKDFKEETKSYPLHDCKLIDDEKKISKQIFEHWFYLDFFFFLEFIKRRGHDWNGLQQTFKRKMPLSAKTMVLKQE